MTPTIKMKAKHIFQIPCLKRRNMKENIMVNIGAVKIIVIASPENKIPIDKKYLTLEREYEST